MKSFSITSCFIASLLFFSWTKVTFAFVSFSRTTSLNPSKTLTQHGLLQAQTQSDAAADPPLATITVCTGPDCRVDGSTQTLKQLQSCVSKMNSGRGNQKSIVIQSKNCLGPCGEGPCVQVLNAQKQRVFQGEQPNREPSDALLPADSFGADTKRIYQVRNADQAAFVLDLAANEANLPFSKIPRLDDASFPPVQSTRAWYDRNNNDRKVLQRLSQVAVAAGLLEYSKTNELTSLQWGIAASIVLASNFIMKDNLLQKIWKK